MSPSDSKSDTALPRRGGSAKPSRDAMVIFISYRRLDTSGFAGRLEDTLRQHFGRHRVFRDVGSIAPGADFVEALETTVDKAGATLVVIGKQWLVKGESGMTRIMEPGDHVASEIGSAIESGRVVIPVLVEGASMPGVDDLPERLHPLARLNAINVSDDRWETDVSRLTKLLSFDIGGSVVEKKLNKVKAALLIGLAGSPVLTGFLLATVASDGVENVGNQLSSVIVAVNYCGISMCTLILMMTIPWINARRRSFAWAAIVLGVILGLGGFIYYLACSAKYRQTEERKGAVETRVLTAEDLKELRETEQKVLWRLLILSSGGIPVLLGLLAACGFKPQEFEE